MTIENAQKDIIDNFLFFDDWIQKYEYIIELSKDLEFMSENLKSEDNLIKGCQSKVWLHAEMVNGKINLLQAAKMLELSGLVNAKVAVVGRVGLVLKKEKLKNFLTLHIL